MTSRRVGVKGYTRADGTRVRSYSQRRTMGQYVADLLRDPEAGGKAVTVAGLFGLGVALWYTFSFTLSFLQAGAATVGVIGGLLALWTFGPARRPRRPRRQKSIIFSPRVRWNRWRDRARRMTPSGQYRRRRDRMRRNHPTLSAAYDRWFGVYEVTHSSGRGKARKVETETVRGIKARKEAVERYKARGESVSRPRQVFR